MNLKSVLERIEENGFEAYIVGGYVRDYLLGITTGDVDICTNARAKEIVDIFDDVKTTCNEYGCVKIVTNELRLDITTYRRDLKYNGDRKKVDIEYVDNLLADINRRDFTMNTLCMNKSGNIIDVLGGEEDIKNKIIRCVGDISERLNEDPLRMLRAVRFATILDFKIEDNLYRELKNNAYLLKQLSKERIKDELTKILANKNALKGLSLLKDLDFLWFLGISYNSDIVYVSDICGMYSQLDFEIEYPFSKEEKDNIKNIKNIIKYGIIDENVLFTYGLYTAQVAGSILNVNKEDIAWIDSHLAIKTLKDINITSEEICDILGLEPNKVIGIVYDELKDLILKNDLVNDNSSIKEYVNNNRKKWLDDGAIA